MADKLQIIAQLILESSDFNKGVDAIASKLQKAKEIQADIISQFGANSAEAKKAAEGVAAIEKNYNEILKSVNQLNDATGESVDIVSELGDEIKGISAEGFDETAKDANKLEGELKDVEKQSKETAQATDELTAAQKRAKKAANDSTKAVKEDSEAKEDATKTTISLGQAIKGLGIIGAITAAFNILKEAFASNQKVADAFAAVMRTITGVVSAVVDVISNVIAKVSESSNGFQALGKVLGGLVTLVITPLKLAFGGISLFIQEAQLAWEQSFFGDDDPKTIKRLNESIEETKKGLKETAENALQAGKDIVTNFGDAISEVGQVVGGVVEGVSKISVSAIYENAKAAVELQNTAKIAAAQLAGIVEQYGAQAEKLRQIRDDDQKSINERIAANEELGQVLQKQQQAQLALVDIKIRSAQADLSANKTSVELQEALINAQNERLAVLNQIAGFESEQLANRNALQREAIAIAKSASQAEEEGYIQRRKNNADLITDELKKNEELQRIRNEDRALTISRLEAERDKYAEGTQARIDAEIALQQKIDELDAEDAAARVERDNLILERSQSLQQQEVENALSTYNLKKQLLEQERMDAFSKAEALFAIAKDEADKRIEQINLQRDADILAAQKAGEDTTQIREKYKLQALQINAELAKSEKDLAKAKIQATVQAADATADTLKRVSELFGKESKAGKALAIASATISTFTSAQKAYESTVGIPIVGPVLAPINAGLAIAAGIKNIQEIAKVKTPGGDAGGSGSLPTNNASAGTAPITPQQATTALPQEQINQLASANATVRAYVVESDVTGNQERITRLNRAARIS